jgi:hypothetical protein
MSSDCSVPYSVVAAEGNVMAERHSTTSASTQEKKDDAPFYCPGCGKRVQYQQQCTGKPESPHPPIEVVSTDELKGDEHTAAPSTENLG